MASAPQASPDSAVQSTPNSSILPCIGDPVLHREQDSERRIIMEASVSREVVFVDLHGGSINANSNFSGVRLLTAAIKSLEAADAATQWRGKGFYDLFGQQDGPATLSTDVGTEIPACFLSLCWQECPLAVDGRFSVPLALKDAPGPTIWAWILMFPEQTNLAGVVVDEVNEGAVPPPRAVFLPKRARLLRSVRKDEGEATTDLMPSSAIQRRVPTASSEAEIAANPEIYTEDPGSYGKPFSNPERIVSETSVYSVFRVEQPGLSVATTGALQEPAFFVERYGKMLTGSMQAQMDKLIALGSERGILDEHRPIQWEGEGMRYQACTVARGHIIEFRIRTRNNGYSLGSVARTLTLAPRQTKRIHTIAWSRSERAQRSEQQRLADTSSEVSTHNTSYSDVVASTLKEQLSGSSSAKASAQAAGFGGALGGCVFGGGAVRGSASAKSQQNARRDATASENTKWREAIRRQGDAVRQYETTVVEEVQEDENVEGSTEVIRNINYAHSITVIYHNILRHLRIDVDFASARECLFVPFAMRPFNDRRAYRWKDTLGAVLLKPQYLVGLGALKQCFYHGNGQEPPTTTDSLQMLQGSLGIKLVIAEPAGDSEGKFCAANWKSIESHLPVAESPQTIWTKTHNSAGSMTFQANYAPLLASKWLSDFALYDNNGQKFNSVVWRSNAARYQSDGTVWASFTITSEIPASERNRLKELSVRATWTLPSGSTAEIKSVDLEYKSSLATEVRTSVGSIEQPLLTLWSQGETYSSAFISCPEEVYGPGIQYGNSEEAVTDLVDHLNANLEYYHKAIWWTMDRDKLFMLLDSMTMLYNDQQVSLANIVERDPITVAGNCLVYRVSPGIFLGTPDGSITSTEELYNLYHPTTVSEPMHISLPTDGVYAQTLMDECVALEEHYGNHDWALADKDPDLGTLSWSELAPESKVDTSKLKPTELPSSIINFTNFSPVPQAQGIAGVLEAVQNGEAFRDMTGLAKTQELVQSSMTAAAGLATSFGERAVALAQQRQAVDTMDRKMASIERAKEKGLISKEDAAKLTNEALSQFGGNSVPKAVHEDRAIQKLLEGLKDDKSCTKKLSVKTAEGGEVSIETDDRTPKRPSRTDPGEEPGESGSPEEPTLDPETAGRVDVRGARPNWSSFVSKYWTYGKKNSSDVRQAIRPEWEGIRLYQDTSCMRLSQALRETGCPIPSNANSVPGVKTFWSDIQQAYYIIHPESMREYLLHVWAQPGVTVEKKVGEDWDANKIAKLRKTKGIVYFEMPEGSPDAHFDLWDGTNFSAELHEDEWSGNAKSYWKLASKVWVWALS